ncbi:hypothetical protein NDU88_002080 [Pleurodeles waltl]|uniref:Uncharacterized protein n=1 Tax=Pleurodeles waltl TaxID=8319 RepID=A0AAV7U9R7_PLEWA|nr:hypothetical protein NDU88_002080 [Pleurodeles waltl]
MVAHPYGLKLLQEPPKVRSPGAIPGPGICPPNTPPSGDRGLTSVPLLAPPGPRGPPTLSAVVSPGLLGVADRPSDLQGVAVSLPRGRPSPQGSPPDRLSCQRGPAPPLPCLLLAAATLSRGRSPQIHLGCDPGCRQARATRRVSRPWGPGPCH